MTSPTTLALDPFHAAAVTAAVPECLTAGSSPAAVFTQDGLTMATSTRAKRLTATGAFDWAQLRTRRIAFEAGAVVFSQGEPARAVMYVETGAVRLSVLSRKGKEAVVAVLEAEHFFGEGCLAGQSKRTATATTMVPSIILSVPQQEMVSRLHTEPAFTNRFLAQMLRRNIRIEEDLVDQRFNTSEKRLARTLLLLARYGEPGVDQSAISGVSQELLADMVGTTRSRVNFFMNRFRKRGVVEYKGKGCLRINHSLLRAVLRD